MNSMVPWIYLNVIYSKIPFTNGNLKKNYGKIVTNERLTIFFIQIPPRTTTRFDNSIDEMSTKSVIRVSFLIMSTCTINDNSPD